MKSKSLRSKHPFEPFIPKGCTKLIIGTIPPERFCIKERELKEGDVNFYYGSKDNYFWQMIESINNLELKYNNTKNAVEQRKKVLRDLKVGVADCIDSCTRIDGFASDEKLKNIKQKNLSEILKNNKEIDTLIYKNRSGYLKARINAMFKTYHLNVAGHKRVRIGGKDYKVIRLYSLSPEAIRGVGKGLESKRRRQYKKYFSLAKVK